MRKLLLFVLSIPWLIYGCSGCDKHSHAASPIAVNVSPGTVSVGLSSTQQFTATVTGSPNQGVDWSLSGCEAFTFPYNSLACGAINSDGVYTAPDNFPGQSAVTIVATSRTDQTVSGEATVTIASTVAVLISPAASSIDIGGTQKFNATVLGSANKEVTWTLSGAGCADNACGTIDATGLYRAPDDPPSPATVRIIATAQADTRRAGATDVAIATGTNRVFRDRYAFLFNGFEDGAPIAIAGSFVSDGLGRVTEGVVDINRLTGPQNDPVTGGVYSFGADNRGRLTLTTARESLSFRFAMSPPSPSGHNGRLISFQPEGRLPGSGVIKKQGVSAFSPSAFQGDFALGLSGALDGGGRAGGVGTIRLDGVGAISGGAMDVNLAGLPSNVAFTSGTYSISSVTGRGTASFSCSASLCPLNLSFYVVSANEAFFVGRDPRSATLPLLSGPGQKQLPGSFSQSSLIGPVVFNVTGISVGSDVAIGRFVAAPAGGTLSGVLDQNASGSVTLNTAFTGTYAILSSGRGALNFRTGPSDDTRYVFYLVSSNRGFLMQSDAVGVGVGSIEPQQTDGPFTAASLTGNWIVGIANAARCACTSVSGVVALTGTDFLGSRDKSASDGLFPRGNWAGNFSVVSGDIGRGTMTTTDPAPPSVENSVFYIVSSRKMVAIDVDSQMDKAVVTILEQ